MWRAMVMGAVLASTASAEPAPTDQVDVLLVDIDRHAAVATTVLVGGNDVWIPAELLCARRVCREATRVHEHVPLVSLRALAPDVTYVLDRDLGELHVVSQPAARTLTTIDLSVEAPRDLERSRSTSLFLNYALAGDAVDMDIRSGHASAAAEAGLTLGPVLIYSAMAAPGGRVVRGLTNASMDLPGKMVRLVAGDDLASSGTLGSTVVVGGLHVRRDFGIDPYFVSRPTLTHRAVVTSPSTVEVYRGGQLVRREAVAPGPFKVEDVVGAVGTDSQIVVKDAYGLSRATITTFVAPPIGLLRPGLATYELAAGARREDLALDSFGYTQPSLLAGYRRGLSQHLTAGIRAEADTRVQNGGVTATTQIGRAAIEGAAAISRGQEGVSGAGSLNVGWQRRSIGMTVLARYVGSRYATLELDSKGDRARMGLEVSSSWSPSSKFTVLATGGLEQHRDAGRRARAGLGLHVLAIDDFALLFTASAGVTRDERSLEGMATLVTTFGRRTAASVRAGAEAGRTIAQATIARSTPRDGGFGYQVDNEFGSNPLLSARGSYTGTVGRVEATLAWDTVRTRTGLAVTGGLVGIGGRVFATRPVQGSFALVRAPGAAGSRVYLENQEIARLDDKGDAVLPELQPYYANRIRLGAQDLPFDISLTELEHLVAPPRRGGTVVRFTAGHGVIVRGSIRMERGGERIDASFGDIVLDVSSLRGPLGHNGVFELEPVAPGEHGGTVELDGATCRFIIRVPEGVRETDVGEVVCR